MKKIKLTGREHTVFRAIDFSTGTTGAEIMEHSRIFGDDLVDVLNGLMDVGFIECAPAQQHVTAISLPATTFEVNPSYALDLREALVKHY